MKPNPERELRMKLMIVEDNPKMRRLIKSVVLDLAEAVYECGDGCDAFEAYVQYRPDWVLMDIEMQRMDGLAATRQITAAYPHARICIVTSYHDANTRAAAHRAGACAYVLKEDLYDVRAVLAVPAPQSSLTLAAQPRH